MKINSLDRPVRLPVRIAEALLREINEGRLRAGDRLPTEQYLAEHFGVSRNVVREAIAQLRSAGMVASRQGVGSVVAQPEIEAPFQAAMAVNADALQFQHVYEIRVAIEMQAATLAARRGDAARFAAIARTLARMQEAEKWETEGVDLDIDFHLAVAHASANPIFAEVIDFLKGRMRETIVATRRRSGRVVGEIKQLTIAEHEAIRAAIVARDGKAAGMAMFRHITNAAHRLGYELSQESGNVIAGKAGRRAGPIG